MPSRSIPQWGLLAMTDAEIDWVLVPREPTGEMIRAAMHTDLSYMPGHQGPDRAAVYRAMLAASPTPAETDAKPVAWQGVAPDGGVFLTGVKRMAEMWEAGDWIVRALYPASPTPPPIGDGEAKPAGYVIATFLVERRGEFERNGTTLYHAPMGMAQTPLYPATAIESLSRQLEEAEAVLSFADEGYANQDVSHEDYRVRVAQAANEYFQDNPDRAKETVSHG